MDFFSTDLVRPLALAENVFLEVLLSDFKLRRRPGDAGVEFEVSFRTDTPAVWNREGRLAVRKSMGAHFDAACHQYQERLEAILLDGKAETFSPGDPEFLWRWASAGTLPVVNMDERSYYCLFYRDIFPLGWNIANGACDTRAELLDPLQALERELGEELVVANPTKRLRYVLKPGEDQALDRPEFGNFRRLWRQQFPTLDLLNFKPEGLAFKLENGPDDVIVRIDDETRRLSGCFVNINAIDFGIELDRIARIAVVKDAVFCDGEASATRVLNRPVGLFDTKELQEQVAAGQHTFIPNRLFHGGQALDGKEIGTVLTRLSTDMREWRTPAEIAAFETAPQRLDLCPVTRNIVRRHAAYLAQSRPGRTTAEPKPRYGVFVSFGEPDEAAARKVFQFIKNEFDCDVFFAPETLPKHPGLWNEAIYSALKDASCFVSVATAAEHLERSWPRFEMLAFHQLHMDNERAQMISFISEFSPCLLPLPLRLYQAVPWPKDRIQEGLDQLRSRLSQSFCSSARVAD